MLAAWCLVIVRGPENTILLEFDEPQHRGETSDQKLGNKPLFDKGAQAFRDSPEPCYNFLVCYLFYLIS